ncbi:MAG TPA: site-specific integrase [Solirubrobacteraceae bacterium]|nr:site-specific integrase [Solirubrobacteraceae bacterium]
MQIAHNTLTRAVQRAAANDLVARNVAALAERPQGQTAGRPSKAMTRDVAIRLVQAAEADSIIGSYLILSVMTGIRPEEARALRWDYVDLDGATIHVWRSTRAHGDVKTVKVPEDVGDRAPGRRGATGSSDAAGARPRAGSRTLARDRPCVHHVHRH